VRGRSNLVYSVHIEWVDYNTTLGKDIYEVSYVSSDKESDEIVGRKQCTKENIQSEIDKIFNSQ
jgi:hypothetical protein